MEGLEDLGQPACGAMLTDDLFHLPECYVPAFEVPQQLVIACHLQRLLVFGGSAQHTINQSVYLLQIELFVTVPHTKVRSHILQLLFSQQHSEILQNVK